MLLINIINNSLQTIEHPFRVIVADLHILAASPAVKLQYTPQLHPGADQVVFPVLGKFHPWLPSRPVDADLDDVCIPAVHKRF